MMDINKVKQEHLTCRSYGHAWEPLRVTQVKSGNNVLVGYHVTMQCSRCEAERVNRMTVTGDVIGNTYRYPEGYLQRRWDDAATLRRIDMRNEWLRRALAVAS